MSDTGLTILISELLGVPKISLSGILDNYHDQVVPGILKGFREQKTAYLVLDLDGLTKTDSKSILSLLQSLRELGPGTSVHVLASGTVSSMLSRAAEGTGIKVYSTLDDIAKSFGKKKEYMTSRWVEPGSKSDELPMAA